MTFPNEKEKIKVEIKVLEAKLSLLEEMEKYKSPCEIAFKRVYGHYPVIDENDYHRWDGQTWFAFQKGYNAAYEEKVEEQGTWNYDPDAKFRKQEEVNTLPEKDWSYKVTDEKGETNPYKQYLNTKKPNNLTDLIYDWWEDAFTSNSDLDMESTIDDLVERIKYWLPKPIEETCGLSENDADWNMGYNTCREYLMMQLK